MGIKNPVGINTGRRMFKKRKGGFLVSDDFGFDGTRN